MPLLLCEFSPLLLLLQLLGQACRPIKICMENSCEERGLRGVVLRGDAFFLGVPCSFSNFIEQMTTLVYVCVCVANTAAVTKCM